MSRALLVVGLLAWLGGFAMSFILGIQSKRLSTAGIVLGATTFWCGFGTIAFLGMAYKAVQQATFDAVIAGADPLIARKGLARFKLAAGTCIAGLVLIVIFAR